MDRTIVPPTPTGFIPLVPLDPCEEAFPLSDVPDDWQVWDGAEWVWAPALRGRYPGEAMWVSARPIEPVGVHPRHRPR